MKSTTNDTEIVLCVEINWNRRYFPPDSILTKISNPFVSHKMDKNGGIFYFLFCRQITKGLRNLLQKKETFPTLLRNQTFFSMYVHPIFMVPLWCANGDRGALANAWWMQYTMMHCTSTHQILISFGKNIGILWNLSHHKIYKIFVSASMANIWNSINRIRCPISY